MKLWKHILTKLQNSQRVYLLTVIENSGSSPGRKGFKMLVSDDGFIFGSIGGGVMEFALVTKAKKLFQNQNPPIFIKKQIHKANTKNGSGMICSGEQTVAFHCLDSHHINIVSNIIACLKNGENGTLCLTPTSFDYSNKRGVNQFECKIRSDEDWVFEEQMGYRETLYIIGGGHVGVAVSELFVKLGFYVVVFDNRENLNTLVSNGFAHQKSVVDYNHISEHLRQGNASYVAIMTHKYTDDKLVLSKLIRNTYKFIGVLGSEAKLKTMNEALLKEGFTQAELDRVHSPIGLTIKSETPEEIAVSIAAQIIQVKNLNRI